MPLLHWTYHGHTAYCILPDLDLEILLIFENFGLCTYFERQ